MTSEQTRTIELPTETIHSIIADEIADGGASHEYRVRWNNGGYTGWNAIRFQKGPVKENGNNGVQNEDLLKIVADRLQCFQDGPYACEENANALSYVLSALEMLNSRTAKREARQVEGMSAV